MRRQQTRRGGPSMLDQARQWTLGTTAGVMQLVDCTGRRKKNGCCTGRVAATGNTFSDLSFNFSNLFGFEEEEEEQGSYSDPEGMEEDDLDRRQVQSAREQRSADRGRGRGDMREPPASDRPAMRSTQGVIRRRTHFRRINAKKEPESRNNSFLFGPTERPPQPGGSERSSPRLPAQGGSNSSPRLPKGRPPLSPGKVRGHPAAAENDRDRDRDRRRGRELRSPTLSSAEEEEEEEDSSDAPRTHRQFSMISSRTQRSEEPRASRGSFDRRGRGVDRGQRHRDSSSVIDGRESRSMSMEREIRGGRERGGGGRLSMDKDRDRERDRPRTHNPRRASSLLSSGSELIPTRSSERRNVKKAPSRGSKEDSNKKPNTGDTQQAQASGGSRRRASQEEDHRQGRQKKTSSRKRQSADSSEDSLASVSPDEESSASSRDTQRRQPHVSPTETKTKPPTDAPLEEQSVDTLSEKASEPASSGVPPEEEKEERKKEEEREEKKTTLEEEKEKGEPVAKSPDPQPPPEEKPQTPKKPLGGKKKPTAPAEKAEAAPKGRQNARAAESVSRSSESRSLSRSNSVSSSARTNTDTESSSESASASEASVERSRQAAERQGGKKRRTVGKPQKHQHLQPAVEMNSHRSDASPSPGQALVPTPSGVGKRKPRAQQQQDGIEKTSAQMKEERIRALDAKLRGNLLKPRSGFGKPGVNILSASLPWLTRWFEIEVSNAGGFLCYFKSQDDARRGVPPLGKIPIVGVQSVRGTPRNETAFVIRAMDEGEIREYNLRAESSAARDSWIRGISVLAEELRRG
uniref:PH domain-containing protein n=1 Tax=Chromera velia CCMP2878 TaxID=1169474 RepID=A0A0G4GAC3_9ALVE|eukprot:Cvel_20981.t1-p1 / transcript=Cvel_20981.t1 / gene=Cvel_20981 / organism=Chromera_velia_CCMP2878 / gene_product=hypothetical protein / transcript_product=hypothetical protein / location=Cvel_scaffold1930:26687-32232(+) / protein_length=803 / sequence_SO=supercontig / SO=protein_coding / is_pseudo=false